ncbi:type IV toxin-antitoxin system AbiEi family antitoxin domain-containing protein [Labedella endophytica]|uniref:Type IV toxin-antitoxin system AbiEi family antitoxin domain-containing protein n=1 Tax=Labedella endophytica TaxID=1523160 RepID=A0A433JVM1_9MICO|nr:hypothetical protein [Labedella endophytica]RUR03201.1 hypothetical protein ELQ94_01200 [Labedella endophytica]
MTTRDAREELPLTLSRHYRELGRGRRPSDVAGHVRVRQGVYTDAASWVEAGDRARHIARIRAVAETRRIDAVFSHRSAAALHGLPTLDPLPTIVDAITSPSSRRRRGTGIDWHHLGLDPSDIVRLDGLSVTSLARTLVDIARTESFAAAVVQLDAALALPGSRPDPERWDRAGERVEREELLRRVDEIGSSPGARRAATAVGFGDGRAESVGESLSRVQMHAWGLPAPELQVPVAGTSGRRYLADFAWNGDLLLGEFDGRVKYSRNSGPPSSSSSSSLSMEDVLWAEKKREDDLRSTGRDMVRWSWTDVVDGHGLIAALQHHGLHARRRQPLSIHTRGTQ